MKRSITASVDRKTHKRSKIDREIDRELYDEIRRNAEETIMPTHIKKYLGTITYRKDKTTPTWRAIFCCKRTGQSSRSFPSEEEAFAHIKAVNKQQGWTVKNIIYRIGQDYFCHLTKGQVMMFAAENLQIVQQYNWNAHYYKQSNCYYASTVKKRDTCFFHSLIRPLDDPKLTVDHINRMTLDNRPENLRLATRSTQAINKKIRCTNTIGVSGVQFDKKAGGYYRAVWSTGNGERASKLFSVCQYGTEIAKQMAIACRKEKEETLPHYVLALSNKSL